MRIDLLITELNSGGAEKALTELAIGFHHRGHRVRVLSIGSAPPGRRALLVDRLKQNGVPNHFGGFDHWSHLFAAKRWLKVQLQDDPPDVCQSFLFHANCLGAFAAHRIGIKTIVGGIRVAEINRLRLILERQAVKRMQHVVCVSRQVEAFAINHLSVNPQRCETIPNGVDSDAFANAEPFDWAEIGWPAESDVVLFLGRFHPQKGIDLIQSNIGAIVPEGTNRRLLLVGDGPLLPSLQRWVASLDVDRVKLIPWQRSVAPLLKAARLLVLPSRYEGMPNVVLEAMAAGLPVVCSRVQGSEELFGDQDDERFRLQTFPIGESESMAQLVQAFLADPDLAASVGRRNQESIAQNYSIGQMVSRYESLYRRLLAR